MATFTQLDDDQVAAIARAFGVGDVVSWRPIAAGTINSNFSLRCDSGRVFLRINEGKTEDDVRYEAQLVTQLAAAGVPVPVPLAGRDGAPFVRHAGRYASMFPWIEGTHRCQASVTTGDVERVGQALARLHRAGAPLAARFERGGRYTFDAIARRVDVIRAAGDEQLADVVALVADELESLRGQQAARAAATVGVIHADLFRDNVLFHGAGVAALLDFEQACTGSLVYDLAVVLNAWCFSDRFDEQLLRATIGGYHQERALSLADRAALPVECRAAAMRFTVTRVTDVYLRDTVATKDFRRFAARLRAWSGGLADRAGSDLL